MSAAARIDCPTLIPPSMRERHLSGFRAGRAASAMGELVECFKRGDYLRVLSLAERVTGEKRLLVRLVPDELVRSFSLDHRQGFILSLVDGRTSVESVLDASAMPLLDALHILCELFEARLVGLR